MIQMCRNAALALLLATLSGCAYDYAQHEDRVSYSAGDAVAANLALHTIDPSKRSMNDTTGLGRDGAPVAAIVADNAGND